MTVARANDIRVTYDKLAANIVDSKIPYDGVAR